MLSRFHGILERNGQRDIRTDIIAISISRHVLSHDKNGSGFGSVNEQQNYEHVAVNFLECLEHCGTQNCTIVKFELNNG